MMTGSYDFENIAQCLAHTLDPSSRKQAEQSLLQIEKSPHFAPLLLMIVEKYSTINSSVQFAAAVYFKNYIKRKWKQVEGETDEIQKEDRDQIKNVIVTLMITVPTALQLQLSEAVTLIADNDFPDQWASLIQDLLSKLSLTNLATNLGVLQTAHSIFKRWRHQFETNALFTEIKYVMEQFSPAYLEFFKAIDGLVDQNAGNAQGLSTLMDTVLLLVKIFYSLNCQDLPEFFEDHMQEFMTIFHKYLVYQNSLLQTDPSEAGVLEKIKAVICEIIDMYASRYESDFKQLPQFVEIIWTLLTSTSNDPCNDVLVSKAISFLTSVVKHERHRQLFENENVMNSICSQIVLPNMMLRESDEELFEDDPIEFIRRDLEGSDTETRRRASADLVRGLLTLFEKQVTDIFSRHITLYLAQYHENRAENWKAKDTALFLITALSAKTLTVNAGATSTNEHIPILQVFQEHIIPDLQQAVDGSIHPIIKVDAIKYLMIFRNQLEKGQILQVLPNVMNHLGSSNYVVNTWAAHCIERILSMKNPGTTIPMLVGSEIASFSGGILTRLFDLIQQGKTPDKLAENDYLMKCILRVVVCTRGDLLPHVNLILERLTFIIREISKNPSNPKFNHFAFETLSAVVKYICVAQPSLVESFESALFAPLQEIVVLDVVEFTPYVFQVLSQLLALHSSEGIPPVYMTLLMPLLQPAPWENYANIPALVNFLSSFLQKGSKTIIQSGHFQAFLGIFQKLISSRVNDHHGLNFLKQVFEYVPTESLHPFTKNLFVLLMTRIFQSKTPKFTKHFLDFLSYILLLEKPGMGVDDVIAVIESIQAGLFSGLLENIIIPEFKLIHSTADRKQTALAMTRLLTQSQYIINTGQPQWPKLLGGLMNLFSLSLSTLDVDEVDAVGDLEETGYQPSFTRLASTGSKKSDIAVDPETYLVQSLAGLLSKNPHFENVIVNGGSLSQEKANELLVKIRSVGSGVLSR